MTGYGSDVTAYEVETELVIDHKALGKANKKLGADTEKRVRIDLQNKGWIVVKYQNNVDLDKGELIQAKNKFRGIGVPMMLGAGFPDFMIHKLDEETGLYEVIGVEVKSNGWINQTEKKKCKWLIDKKIFSKIWIASWEKSRNRISLIYKEPRKVKDEN